MKDNNSVLPAMVGMGNYEYIAVMDQVTPHLVIATLIIIRHPRNNTYKKSPKSFHSHSTLPIYSILPIITS